MPGLFTLLSLSIVMAIASFLAGILPLSIKLSRDKLRLISTIGMGVLVGTSLIVIIPEGVEALYRSGAGAQKHVRYVRETGVEHNLAIRTILPLQAHTITVSSVQVRDAQGAADLIDLGMPGPAIPNAIDVPPKTPTEPGIVGIMDTDPSQPAGKVQAEDEAHHAWVGVALISGFVLMFLIDKVPQSAGTSRPKARTHHIALNNLGSRFNLSTNLDREEEAETFLENSQTDESKRRSFATTIGLVIHAAADGIALGASSSTGQTRLSFVIFFAIMLHKAPAAFGLTSILLRQGLSKRMARAHLIIFSLAAPVGAILTWNAAYILGVRSSENAAWWTGILLLFSAGTFLYVAMHAMQETMGGEVNNHGPVPNGSVGESPPAEQHKPSSMKELAAAVFGMILPLFLQVGHAH